MLNIKESTEEVTTPKILGKLISIFRPVKKKKKTGVILATPYLTVMCKESFDRLDKRLQQPAKRNPKLAKLLADSRKRIKDG